jgi:hypothetical protein
VGEGVGVGDGVGLGVGEGVGEGVGAAEADAEGAPEAAAAGAAVNVIDPPLSRVIVRVVVAIAYDDARTRAWAKIAPYDALPQATSVEGPILIVRFESRATNVPTRLLQSATAKYELSVLKKIE